MKTQWPADKVERRSVASLAPYARNARTHSDDQVAQIANAVREWGWTNPVLIDEDGLIIAGHGRVLAAQELGLKDVPVMIARGWSEDQKRAYTLADNRLAEHAGWDDGLLSFELGELADHGFDLSLAGFDPDAGEGDEASASSGVKRVETSLVEDIFWISVRGPLASQAEALTRLQEVMAAVPGVEVDLGTIQV